MVWAKVEALLPLFDLALDWQDYPAEPLPYDGSILHALERLLPLVAAKQGFRSVLTNVPGITRCAETLLADGQDVCVFDQPGARYLEYSRQQGATIVAGNFLDADAVRGAIAECDVVYHLVSATVPQTSNENPCFDVEVNLLGTLQLLDQMRQANVKKIIFSSSGGTVYGIPQEIPIKESHPTDPISSYGIVKLAIEKYLHLYWTLHGIDYRILRVSNAYGARQPITATQGAIAAFLGKAIAKEEIVIWGDGTVLRDYVYASDIAHAFLQASRYEGKLKVFNIGSGHGHSLNDLIAAIESITQVPLQVKYLPGRPFDVPVNVLDTSRAKAHLGWEPKVRLEEGVFAAWQWMQTHQSG
jgi:UDP-glucose 4-epimerase